MRLRSGWAPKEKVEKSCCCCICGIELDLGIPMIEVGSKAIGGGEMTAVPQIWFGQRRTALRNCEALTIATRWPSRDAA